MKKRVIIDSWDWHYKVGFDKALARRLKLSADELEREAERHILLQQLDIFSSMVSISALCDALEEAPSRFHEFLAGIDAQRLLYIPPSLAAVLQERIEQLPNRLTSEKWEMTRLLAAATTSRFVNYHKDIFDPVFGSALTELTHRSLDRISFAPEDKLIDRNDLRMTVNGLLESLMNGSHVQAMLGDVVLPCFEIVLKDGVGFAEYWPAELLASAFDNQLTVFNNPDQSRIGALQATLPHEILGHGVFYKAASDYAPPFFDHGAMCLIEGWATWCEWHASATPHGEYARSARLFGLRHFYEEDVDELLHGIPLDIRKLGYSDAAATSGLMYFFQYPGFSLSYTLGALWFEKTFRSIHPAEFFMSLNGRPWGDFFRTW